jgi:hypothetical protein
MKISGKKRDRITALLEVVASRKWIKQEILKTRLWSTKVPSAPQYAGAIRRLSHQFLILGADCKTLEL